MTATDFCKKYNGVRVVNGKPQPQVTHGKCKLVTLVGSALLWIRPNEGKWQDYYVFAERNDDGRVTGFTLELLTGHVEDCPTVYHIDASFGGGPKFWFCDCPDAKCRKRNGCGGCKHIRALAAAMVSPDELVAF